jgi:hypothetical protein
MAVKTAEMTLSFHACKRLHHHGNMSRRYVSRFLVCSYAAFYEPKTNSLFLRFIIVDAQIATLYVIRTTSVLGIASPLITVSPVGGVGKDGATTYVEEIHASYEDIEHITGYTTYYYSGGVAVSPLIETSPSPKYSGSNVSW